MSEFCDDRCQTSDQHRFYVAGGGFRWRWPKFDLLRLTDRGNLRVMLNRYPHNVIGAGVCVRGYGVFLRWKGSR